MKEIKIIRYLESLSSAKSFNEIASAFKIKGKKERIALSNALIKLEKNKKVVCKNEKYSLLFSEFVEGKIKTHEKGFAFLITENGDFFIGASNLKGALQGDTVRCRKIGGRQGDEVSVVSILSRGEKMLCGVYFRDYSGGYVRPDDKGYLTDIFIDKNGCSSAKEGDKVFVEIISYDKYCPRGEIVAILGRAGELDAEIEAVVHSFGFANDFSENIKKYVAQLNQKVGDNELIGRLNLTNELIFTIDGDDAKDFDDAVSLTVDKNGIYHLGVHIADVTNYVERGSLLDKEAYERGTSVYFPQRVIPMLPFELSNGICSLREGELRLTVSVFADINRDGEILSKKIEKSCICSRHRMTYNDVQGLIDGDNRLIERYSDIYQTVLDMNSLKKILKNRRDKKGEIDLKVEEADIFYKNGKIELAKHASNDATTLIEQFMVLANEIVAEYLFSRELPCLYRVHDKPNQTKLDTFVAFLASLGVPSGFGEAITPADFNSLLKSIQDTTYFDSVNKVMLRTMQKAVYSPKNIGHFGLASSCYCHFTSPIRRYPDLLVHRVLKSAISGEGGSLINLYADFFVKAAEQCSFLERRADEAERTMDDLFKTAYLREHIGEEFDATVSGVAGFGIFAELDNTAEGLIRTESLLGDRYFYDEAKQALTNGKNSFTLGDKIKIRVDAADISSKRAEFSIVKSAVLLQK